MALIKYLACFVALVFVCNQISFVRSQTMTLASTARDQSPRYNPAHFVTDFEWMNPGKLESGIVQNQLNLVTRKPVYAWGNGLSPLKSIHNQTTFDTWFNDSPQTINVLHNLTLTSPWNGNSRLYGYQDMNYFPLDGKGYDVPAGHDQYLALDNHYHNFHFCNEAHGRFAYKGGEQFNFLGDDDVWAFINNQLAMDIGGVHGPIGGSFYLDSIAQSFGLTIGNNYRFDFFWCERHTLGSDITLSTSLEVFCAYYDWCDQCDGDGQSCCPTGACNDGLYCTQDLCAVTEPPTQSCQHLPVNCTASTNPCYTTACSEAAQGQCVNTNVNCPSNPNDACQISACDPTKGGCYTYTPNCDDNNDCTDDSCVPATGQCQHIDNSARCDGTNKCLLYSCDPTLGCQTSAISCDDNNDCTIDTCSPTQGCIHTTRGCGCNPALCPTTNPCNPQSCNSADNTTCISIPITCDDNNPCTTDQCIAGSKTYTCSNIPNPCPAPDLCTLSSCNMTTGKCVNTAKNCDDGLQCTYDKCNPTDGTCSHTLNQCDDNNACTTDGCSNYNYTSTGGCFHTPIPCLNTTCQIATCDPTQGCVFAPYVCPVASNSSYCSSTTCDDTLGCLSVSRTCLLSNEPNDPSHWVDNYPQYWKVENGQKFKDEDCFTASCDPTQNKCVVAMRTPWTSTCGFAYLSQGAKAGVISGGVIAGIAIGAVIFAALAGFGAKKGYDAWVRMRDERMGAASTNPMYAPSASSGTSALYA